MAQSAPRSRRGSCRQCLKSCGDCLPSALQHGLWCAPMGAGLGDLRNAVLPSRNTVGTDLCACPEPDRHVEAVERVQQHVSETHVPGVQALEGIHACSLKSMVLVPAGAWALRWGALLHHHPCCCRAVQHQPCLGHVDVGQASHDRWAGSCTNMAREPLSKTCRATTFEPSGT